MTVIVKGSQVIGQCAPKTIVKSRYAIKEVNPKYYGKINVIQDYDNRTVNSAEASTLEEQLHTTIFKYYKTDGNFERAFSSEFPSGVGENDRKVFLKNLTSVFSYLVDNNIDTDNIKLFFGCINLSTIIVGCLYGLCYKKPDAEIKNGKRFFDTLKRFCYEKDEYLKLISEKVDHPLSGVHFAGDMLSEFCEEICEVLKKP